MENQPVILTEEPAQEVVALKERIASLEAEVSELRASLHDKEELGVLITAISDQSSDAFFVHNEEGWFIEANQQACDKLGYTKEELLGMHVFDIEMDLEADRAKKKWKEIQPGERFTSKGHNRKKDGSLFPVEVRFGCALWKSVKVFVGFVKDVSDRYAAEEERRLNEERLRASEEKFRNVFEVANVGKSLTLVTGEMFVNKAFSDMLGYEREELQMKSWKEITPAEDLPQNEKLIEPIYAGKQDAVRLIKRYLVRSYIWTDVSGTLVRDENGKGLYHVATIIDITDRVNAEEALEKLNRELENKVRERTLELETANQELQAFNYSVSHDLRAPLRVMKTYAGILADDYSGVLDDTGKKYLMNIHKSAERMDRLITDLLNLSQVSRSELRPEEVNMHDLAESVYFEIAAEQERREFTFTLNDLPPAFCDASLIRQVWQNLLGNALKYSSRSAVKKIRVYATTRQDEITYYVEDHGAGFDEAYTGRLFTAFQRLHNSSEFPGNGIGLAIVHQIISRHGGSASAKGKQGEGAVFSFTLKRHHHGVQDKKTIKQYPT